MKKKNIFQKVLPLLLDRGLLIKKAQLKIIIANGTHASDGTSATSEGLQEQHISNDFPENYSFLHNDNIFYILQNSDMNRLT